MKQAADQITYLNDGQPPPFTSRLLEHLEQSKQARATTDQWQATVRALTQKGVKAMELEESGVLSYLAGLAQSQMLTRQELIEEIRRRYYTIKEVMLGEPKYSSWRQPGGSYREYLYIANSERDNIEDELAIVNWEMEELAFNPERILHDPSVVVRLERRREELMSRNKHAIEFTAHHFSDKIDSAYGKNLLAHCRVSIHGQTYFIEEIQSDWAQRGRKSAWAHIVKGPLVTSTEAWAGMVLRRHLQLAASTPGISQVAWITESMRNGGRQNLQREADKDAQRKAYRDFVAEESQRQLQAIGAHNLTAQQLAAARELIRPAVAAAADARGLREPYDMLNDFYLQVLPKLADKALGKSGACTKVRQFTLDRGPPAVTAGVASALQDNLITVPCIELSPAARQVLVAAQPMYSRTPLRLDSPDLTRREHEVAQAIARTEEMLGSARHLRMAKHVYDVATGTKVAGLYINGLVRISLQAHDLVEVAEHECLHFAVENLLQPAEVAMLRSQFADGTRLNMRVRQILRARGMTAAARQCDDPLEAAAHGFTLWGRGLLDVEPSVAGLFADLVCVARDCMRWFRRIVFEERCTSVEELFRALSTGELAQHDLKHGQERERPRRHGRSPAHSAG